MTSALAWLLAAVGLALTHRAANRIAGQNAATLASVALLLGQLVTFPLPAIDAAIFALAAIAVERGLALTDSGRRFAWVWLILPSLGPLVAGAGWPSGSKIIDVLFCSQHGIAATSAVLWLGFAGALLDRRTALGLLALVITASAAFAPSFTWQESVRLFAAALPIAGVGLGLLTARLRDVAGRRPAWATAALLTPLLLFNVTLVVVAQRGGFRPGEPVAFADVGAAQVRLMHDWIGHPLSFPATLLFRATTGLPASRFDRQGLSHLDAAHPIVVDIGGAGDVAWVGEGWHGPEREGETSYRWANRVTEVFLPPLPAGRVVIRVRLRPATAASMPAQTVALNVGVHAGTAEVLADEWVWIEREIDLGRSGQRATRLLLTFDHAVRPSAVSASGDQRDLAAAIDRIEIIVR
ncbi:MAG TPA: hypothetical protein VFV98_06170 [Vicinamibacterales bacterium]|nr:hypothetical protein [Vicinamibacterales bacterium]